LLYDPRCGETAGARVGWSMIEFDFKRSSRRCHRTERDLKPGEVYYSALVEQGEEFVRLDFSESAWEGPPEGALGWWRSRIPERDAQRVYWAPSDVLLAYFQELETRPEKAATRYVMALLLQQKRLLALRDVRVGPNGQRELVLHSARLKADFVVPDIPPAPQQLREIQETLTASLFTDQPTWEFDEE
jgi:hypothetical protein